MFKEKHYKDLIVSANNISRGRSLLICIQEIKSFLEKNPNEFVIIKMRSEGDNVQGFCNNIVAHFIKQNLQKWVLSEKDLENWFHVETMTIGDILCREKRLLILTNDKFFESYMNKLDKDYFENSEIARENLTKMGIFPIAKFLRDEKFKSDDVQDLLVEMDKSFQHVIRKLMRVNHYVFTGLKKLQIKYLWKPPTINGMEKNEFSKDNVVVGHVVESINKGKDINIGK
jgi:hypothetical protein